MGKKIFGFVIGMLVLSMLLPSITAATTFENKKQTMKNSESYLGAPEGKYKNCYIEVSADIHHDWPAIIKLSNMLKVLWIQGSDSNKVSFGLYSYFVFENNAMITVYDKKDGAIVWQHQGIQDPTITMLGFKGTYESSLAPSYLTHFTIDGTVRLLSIRLYDFPNPN